MDAPDGGLRIGFLGIRAVLVEAEDDFSLPVQQRIWRMTAAVGTWDGVQEAYPGVTNLTAVMHHPIRDREALAARLRALWAATETGDVAGRTHEIRVRYDGCDLDDVARACGLSPGAVIEMHMARSYTVYAIGHHPGYGYLGRLDDRLAVPRRDVPRVHVPARSVTIAGLQTSVSASDGPTGWHVIGSTDVDMFDPRRDPPALLSPGDQVRFVPA